MIDLETAARRVLSVAECHWGNDPRFFVELSCAIADLRAALERQTCECSHVPTNDPVLVYYGAEDLRAALDTIRKGQECWASQFVPDDGSTPEEKS